MRLLLAAAALLAAPAAAQVATPPAPRPAPRLIVAISVDQLSADLFAQYRNRYTGGLARLLNGAVFPSGYQGHAATETCPGHSTILTGYRPANTGIIANNWIDQRAPRADKTVYCAEDERVPGSTSRAYTVSAVHLKVPTLGERMKAANPASRVVSVAGKDRAAVMMGGHQVDELWWWDGATYSSYAGRAVPPAVQRTRDAVTTMIAQPQAALPLPGHCAPLDRPISAGDQVVGQGRFARAAGDTAAFRRSPASDAAVLAMAAALVQDMKLGQGAAPDLIAVGLSATDYIGHAYGTQGTEMCIQQAELDTAIGGFLDVLDATGVDYQLVLTADHGAHDMVERQHQRAMPRETHVAADVNAGRIGAAIGRDLNIPGPVLLGAEGDVWFDIALTPAQRARAQAEALRRLRALPQVAAVFTAAEIAATPMPSAPPETWTLIERARASYAAGRSGDLLVLLKHGVTSIEKPGPGYVETHGSPWDYDRRVPIVFWRRGLADGSITIPVSSGGVDRLPRTKIRDVVLATSTNTLPGFEQPQSVETVDIAPTLAALLGLAMPGVDGRCLDLDPGPASTCP